MNKFELPSDLTTLTLPQAWEHLVFNSIDDITDRTSAEYRQSLAIWRRLASYPQPEGADLHNPPLGLITREITKSFRDKLLSTPYRSGKSKRQRSRSTVNRIMRDLHVCLSPLWPADRVNPGGLGLVELFKWPKALSVQKKLPFVFNASDLDRLYLNAGACRQKDGRRKTHFNNPRLWRLALVLALNCAARAWDLFGLRWSDVTLEDEEPFEFGSILFGARKTLKLHKIPLNECAMRHLVDLRRRPVAVDNDRIFPGFSKGKTFYRTWDRICAAAETFGTFESMRKTSVTRHNSVIWQSGYWLSGHIEPGVFGSYDNPSDRIFKSVYSLENPPEFIKGALKLGAV